MDANANEHYRNIYSRVLNTGGIGLVSRIIHKNLKSRAIGFADTILELGAGGGQHFELETQEFNRYLETNIRLSNLPIRPQLIDKTVEQMALDAEDLQKIPDNSTDRSVASCLLIHLGNPEKALEEWRRVVKAGAISFYVPCEPGLLLRLLRYLTTVRKANRLGVDHLSFYYREHVTYFVRLNLIIKEVFHEDHVRKVTGFSHSYHGI